MENKKCVGWAGLLLCVLLTMLLGGCQQVDPRSVYTQAQKKTAALSGSEEHIQLTLVLDPEGQSSQYTWDITAKFVQDDKSPQMEIRSENTFPDRSFYSYSLYSGGRFFADDNGEKNQAEMEYSVLVNRLYRIYPTIELSTSQMKDLAVEETSEGLSFSFQVSAGSVKGLADFAMNQIQNFSGYIPTDVSTKTAQGQLLVDKNTYITQIQLEIPCVVTRREEEIQWILSYQRTLESPGQSVSVQIEDPDSYQEGSIWDLPW